MPITTCWSTEILKYFVVISALVWGLAGAIAIGLGVGMAYGLKDLLPSLIHSSANVESTLKRGQKVRFDKTSRSISNNY
jgi:hypothetical protein